MGFTMGLMGLMGDVEVQDWVTIGDDDLRSCIVRLKRLPMAWSSARRRRFPEWDKWNGGKLYRLCIHISHSLPHRLKQTSLADKSRRQPLMLRQTHRTFTSVSRLGDLNAFIFPSSVDGRVPVTPKVGGRHGGSSVDGLLVAVKDNICTASQPTTCASNILHGFNSPFPATVVKLLEEAGATVVGKTNLDEFGMG